MNVTRCDALPARALATLLGPPGLELVWLGEADAIPGSYWGEPEAGLVGRRLYLRPDTPVHSALHEACHWLCMDEARKAGLHTDAGGTDTEENAVCYLQCLLAERLAGYSRAQVFADMDAWGYSFILGSAAAWFAGDSDDATRWLLQHGLAERDAGGLRPILPVAALVTGH
ncbi:MAG: hypothetical protein C0434_16955 [Xanthomonadaceae bacterium]|nr:hypothetical protein [Xanthomonadaceae bacterium]